MLPAPARRLSHPLEQQFGGSRRDRNLPPGGVRFRIVDIAAVDPLLDLDHGCVLRHMAPLETEHFTRPESREDSHVQQKLLPQFDSSQRGVHLVHRHGARGSPPKANAVCERLGGSLHRECLDFLIPLTERHLKMTVEEWRVHYNRGRPHSSLGPGVPESNRDCIPASGHRHRLPAGYGIAKTSVLGGLHHEYRLVKEAA